jgi:tripartite-type tricarboxylate transporter receptor subunit TctC
MKGYRFAGLVCTFILLISIGFVQAQEKYPSRPIELVVTMAPGGFADIAARIYGEELSQILKTPVNVVNRPGGTGIVATTYVLRSPKDGYTLLQGASSTQIIATIVNKEATFDTLKDLIALGYFGSVPCAFSVRTDSPIKTLNDLIEYARKNPGKLKNGAGGVATESDFDLAILCMKNNIKISTVPFSSGGEALPALLGGHVDMATSTMATFGPSVKGGKLRVLAVTSEKRHPDFPEIPTTAELGHPYISFYPWVGVFAPTGIPTAVQNVLVPAIEKAFKNPEVISRAAKANITVEYKGPEEYRKLIAQDLEVLTKVAQEANMIKK